MDYIPGTMFNATQKSFWKNNDTPMEQGTRVHSMALAVICESPMQMLPDAPSSYYKEEECTGFLTRIPVEWDEIRPLAGKVGDYVAVARRNGTAWYVAAITDWDARKLTIRFDFLEEGKVYDMELFKDGPNAGTMAVDYAKENRKVSKGDAIEVDMTSGGGWVARIY
jgi:alpha-glucosidase